MNGREKIVESSNLFSKIIPDEISELKYNKVGKELKILLSNGVEIYVVYNDHHQYSYTIIYSNSKYDRKRFDNYDDRWSVNTRPHHYHIRGSNQIIESPMVGNPNDDIPLLIKDI